MIPNDGPRPGQALCSITRDQLPSPNQPAAGRIKLQPPSGLRLRGWVDWDPPPRTHRPWVDDPRFGLKDD